MHFWWNGLSPLLCVGKTSAGTVRVSLIPLHCWLWSWFLEFTWDWDKTFFSSWSKVKQLLYTGHISFLGAHNVHVLSSTKYCYIRVHDTFSFIMTWLTAIITGDTYCQQILHHLAGSLPSISFTFALNREFAEKQSIFQYLKYISILFL